MATHNTGTTATLGESAHTTPFTFTIPAGVAVGDVMIVGINTFSFPLSGPATSTPTSGGGAWTPIGPLVAAENGTAGTFATAWWRVATASDPNSTFTISWTGGIGSTDGFWWTATHDSYSGFWVADPIAQSITPAFGAETAVGTTPSGTALRAGSWVVQLGPITPDSGGSITGVPSGMTQRQLSNGNSGVCNASADSAGSAGAVGAAIGGGSFTTSNATDNWWTEWTIELATVAAGGPAVVSAPVAPPLIPPHPHFTAMLLEEAWQRADWQAQGVADLTVSYGSSSGGIDTWNVTSPWAGGSTTMRVLAPVAPSASYPHAFLVMLPVDANQDTTFGDSIGVAQGLGAHNAFNLTCIQPGYPGVSFNGPWYADNPLDPTISYEKYTLLVVAWIRANLAITGNEAFYLIGFSRSGLGGQGLQLRHPDLFAATASWDFPAMMADYDGTDPTNGGAVGGSPALFYGTSSNFTTNWQLAPQLAVRAATGQYGVNRIWIGLGPAFGADVPAYDSALTSAGIPHTYTFANTSESHAWQPDWVQAALSAIIPSSYAQATTMLPQQVPHPLLESMLDLASLRLDPGMAPVQATVAALDGTGSLAASPALTAAAALDGSGSLGASPQQAPSAAMSGSGGLAASSQLSGAAALDGSGTLGAAPGQQAAPSMSGSGSVTALPQLPGTASLSGSGTLGAAPALPGGAAMAGSGSLAVAEGLAVPLSGAGSLAGSEALPAVLSGSGTLSALQGSMAAAALSGAGSLSSAPAEGIAAPLSGSGTLSAAPPAGTAVLSGSGTMGAAPRLPEAGPLSGSGALAPSPALSARSPLSGAGTLSAAPLATVRGAASLTAPGTLAAVASGVTVVSAASLWTAFTAASEAAGEAWAEYRMMRQAGGTDGTAGFLYGAAYRAQQAADQAYEAWRRGQAATFPGATG
jgi:hypothetical protein